MSARSSRRTGRSQGVGATSELFKRSTHPLDRLVQWRDSERERTKHHDNWSGCPYNRALSLSKGTTMGEEAYNRRPRQNPTWRGSINVIASGRERVYSTWFLSLLETGASTPDAVFVLTDVRDTCVQSALTYGNRTVPYTRHHSPSSDGLCGIRKKSEKSLNEPAFNPTSAGTIRRGASETQLGCAGDKCPLPFDLPHRFNRRRRVKAIRIHLGRHRVHMHE